MNQSSEQPPFFSAVGVRFLSTGLRLYRVYVLPEELVFIYVGRPVPDEQVVAASGAHGGVLGLLLARALFAVTSPEKKNKVRLKHLDATPLDNLVEDHKHNLRATAADTWDICLSTPSFWQAAIHSPHLARLSFNHATSGKLHFYLKTPEDVQSALELLPEAFSDRIEISIEWNAKKKKFVKRRHLGRE